MIDTNTIQAGERTQSGFMKHAWIRDSRVPQGQPALGKIDCPCGQMPWTKFDSLQPNIICKCGTEYTWDGWIVKKVADESQIEAPDSVKFLKKGVKAGGKYYPCWYSLATLISGKTAITIYAKKHSTGLPRELHPENNSDIQTDYFEKDKVRFYKGSFTFEMLKPFAV